MESSTAGGWYPDPTSRFELRYHNGSDWTADVSSNGTRFVDPLGVQPGSGTGTKNGLATASMVLGIVGVVLGWLPFVFVLGVIAAVLALVFGFVGRRRSKTTGTGRGFSTAGLILGAAALVVAVVGVLFTIAFVDALDAYETPAVHEAEIVSCRHDGADHTAEVRITNRDDRPAEFTVRLEFVRNGTDNMQREVVITFDELQPGETARESISRRIQAEGIDCVIGDVRGPLPFGVDPGV